MALLNRFKQQSGETQPQDRALSAQLAQVALNSARDPEGHVHIEDAISAAATILAERCIEAAGDFPLRDHDLTPGSRVFSKAINELLLGDVAQPEIGNIPAESVIGSLRAMLPPSTYPDSDFPSIMQLLEGFVRNIGKPEDWGRVPLSVPATHFPASMPLQVGYETREQVDQILRNVQEDKMRCINIATYSVAQILMMVASKIDHKIALTLAIETINGMCKTAPMTRKAMLQVSEKKNIPPV